MGKNVSFKAIRVAITTSIIALSILGAYMYKLVVGRTAILIIPTVIWKYIADLQLYCAVAKNGQQILGTIDSYSRPIFGFGLPSGHRSFGGSLNITFRYILHVSFAWKGATRTEQIWGAIFRLPAENGTAVSLICWNEYIDKVILSDKKYFKSYFIYTFCWCALLVVVLIVALLQ